jgi:hypothetical protein
MHYATLIRRITDLEAARAGREPIEVLIRFANHALDGEDDGEDEIVRVVVDPAEKGLRWPS